MNLTRAQRYSVNLVCLFATDLHSIAVSQPIDIRCQ
jgi:hypothetical protein